MMMMMGRERSMLNSQKQEAGGGGGAAADQPSAARVLIHAGMLEVADHGLYYNVNNVNIQRSWLSTAPLGSAVNRRGCCSCCGCCSLED
jgi:hypothetical protein